MTVLSPAELVLLRQVFRYAYSHDWERDTQGPCGGLERGTRRWEDWDNRHVELDAYGTLDINGMAEIETEDLGVRCTVDILVAVGLLPAEFSSAYRAGYDALEEQGSKLTAENELKRRRIEELEAELRRHSHPVVKAVAEIVEDAEAQYRRAEAAHDAKDEANRRWLDVSAKLAALEAKPTSGPPTPPGGRGGLRPEDIHGYSQIVADTAPQLVESMELARMHRKGDHSACSAEWCAEATWPQPSAEAGIAAEDNLPGLTEAERDDFMGGAA